MFLLCYRRHSQLPLLNQLRIHQPILTRSACNDGIANFSLYHRALRGYIPPCEEGICRIAFHSHYLNSFRGSALRVRDVCKFASVQPHFLVASLRSYFFPSYSTNSSICCGSTGFMLLLSTMSVELSPCAFPL
nr:hypothetical protein GZ17A3_17 [uncultured archaeon GZfos17A3]